MKLCQKCQNQYPDDANFCPQESCATPEGPRRLLSVPPLPARYEVRGLLGGEESGLVLLASDSPSQTEVALKIASPAAMPTATTVDRALRELKQLSRASSPHVAKVLDFGKTEDGRLYVASEKINGRTLEEAVNQDGPFPLDRAKKIVAQIGDALLDGQKVGVVHRDLAPKNVILGEGDAVKLLNFVLPRPAIDHVFGVPAFLSPEQAEGKLVDQRSNTYGLAAILYFMVTGVPPFSGSGVRETLEAVLKTDLVPPSIRLAGLPAEVDRVVGKAMEKTSSRRPLTLRQFLNDVAGLSAGQSGPTHAPVAAEPGKSPFAQTMVFGVSSKDVQQLVQQALAARSNAAAGAAAPAAAPPTAAAPTAPAATAPTSLATPAPQSVPGGGQPGAPLSPVDTGRSSRGHGAAVAATMVAMPAAGGRSLPGAAGVPLPAPATPAAAPVASPSPSRAEVPSEPKGETKSAVAEAPAAPAKAGGANNFRETLWFKKGDVDQMVAEAKAKLPGAKKPTTDPDMPTAAPGEDAKPLEDRYVDDGSVTADDRKKFSLRTGGTSTSLPMVKGQVPGDRMSETEMLDELSGKRRMLIGGVIAVVVVAIVAVLAVSLRGGRNKAPTSSASPPGAASVAAEAPSAPPASPGATAVAPPSAAPAAAEPAATPPAAVPPSEVAAAGAASASPVAADEAKGAKNRPAKDGKHKAAPSKNVPTRKAAAGKTADKKHR